MKTKLNKWRNFIVFHFKTPEGSCIFESESHSVVSDSLWSHGVHGILQARILKWVAFPFSRGSSLSRDRTQVSCIAGRLQCGRGFNLSTTREALYAESLMRNAGLEEAEAGIKIAGRNINNLMATHSSVLAWRIPGMGEPGGLPSPGSHRVRHYWSDLAVAAADMQMTPPLWQKVKRN